MQIDTLRVKKSFTILKTLLLVGDTIYVEVASHRDLGRTVDWHYIFLADRTLLGSIGVDHRRSILDNYVEKIEEGKQ